MKKFNLLSKLLKNKGPLLAIFVVFVAVLTASYVFAASWNDRSASGSRTWTGLAMSTNGAVILAADNSSSSANLYKSTDGGVTWNAVTNGGASFQKQWKQVASNSDGTKFLASEASGDVYYSIDSGANWTATGLGTASWTGLCMSSDGTVMEAIANGTKVGYWYSTNSGTSWTDTAGLDALTPNTIACSSDGAKVIVGMFGSDVYTSTNTGSSWTSRTITGGAFVNGVASSSDGTKLAAVVSFVGDLWTSSNSGVSWTDQTAAGTGGGGLWQSVGMSGDGTKLVATSTVNVRTSTDSGVSWTTETTPGTGTWKKGVYSSDGTYIAIAGTTTHVWTYGNAIIVAPTVTTQAASSITTTTATFNGNITATGNENPSTRGFNYGLTTGYGSTISTSGSYSTGAYTGSATGLTCNTTYHYRGFATNTGGTGNGGDQSFTTSACPTVPVVTSGSSSGITSGSAIGAGNITSTGGENPTSRYVEYGLTTGYGSQTPADSGSFSTGAFTENIRGLTAGTLYHWRACATNTAGNGCGSDQTFTTLTTPGAPTGLSGTAGFTQVSLSWTAPVSSGDYSITDYIVEYKLSAGSTWYAQSHTASTTTSAIVSNLTNGTSYDFRVYAVSYAGAGSASGTASATPSSTLTVPGIPTGLTATTGSTQVALSWTAPINNGGASITDYTVEYKTISAISWTTFSHVAGTATSRTVTGLTNGTDYNFRVSAVNSVGTGAVSSTATAPAATGVYYHILGTGQSLSEGVNATPALTTTQPYSNKSLTNTPDGGLSSPLIPLVETVNSRESPASGMANSLAGAIAGAPTFVVGIHGQGGQTWDSIKKGGSGTAYANGQTQASVTKTQTELAGAFYQPYAVTMTHGETDQINGVSSSTYAGYMGQGQIDYQTDWNTLTGLSGTIPMFETQMNTNSVGNIAVGQFLAHKNYSGKVILVGPKYQLTYGGDFLHLTNTASKFLGELYAKVIKKVVNDGQTWNPLMPTSVTNVGNVVTVSYAIPTGTLAIDTTNVALRTNKGFEFTQTGGSAITISSVVLDGSSKKVIITLSGTPDGTNPHIRYAWGCANHPNDQAYATCGNPSDNGADGGNIRDTDSSVSPASNGTGLPLYDWGITFDEAITTATAPDVPTNLSATLGNTQASLTWTAPVADGGAYITDYYLEYKTASASTWSAFSHGASTSTSATITGLTNGTNYMFRVSAISSYGTGAPSNIVYAEPATTPGTPTALTPMGGAQQVALTWSAPASDGGALITNYIVEYKRTVDPGWTTFTHTLSNATSATVTSLLAATSYDFRVTAVNAIGNGSATGTSTASTNAASAPGAPTALGTTPGNTQVALSWTAPADNGGASITDYLVEYKLTSDLSWTTFVDGVSASTSATVTGLTNGSSYDFRVSAINSAGTGTASATASGTPRTVPGAPTALSASAGDTLVTLSWTAPGSNGGSSITDYLVEYKLTSDVGWSTFADGTSTSTGATVTSLTNGLSYDFRVSATNVAGTGSVSGTASATPVLTVVRSSGRNHAPLPQPKRVTGAHATNTYVSPIDSSTKDCPGFTKLVQPNSKLNDIVEVKLWQAFLNKSMNESIPLTGFYGPRTRSVLERFQLAYKSEILVPANLVKPNGRVAVLTRTKANKLLGCIQ
jgi:titin